MFSSVFCFLLKIHCPPVFSVFSLFLLLSSQTSLLEALSTLKFCFLPLLSPSLSEGFCFLHSAFSSPPWVGLHSGFWFLFSAFCSTLAAPEGRLAPLFSAFCFLVCPLSAKDSKIQRPSPGKPRHLPPMFLAFWFLHLKLYLTRSYLRTLQNVFEGCAAGVGVRFILFSLLLSAFCFLLSAF